MSIHALRARSRRIRAFCAAASSVPDIGNLLVAGIARDNPFGGARGLGAILGKFFDVVQVRTRAAGGEPAWIDARDLGQLVSCEEVLVEGAYDLSRVPFSPDVVVDCGAHIGLFSLIAGVRFSQAMLLAFEPSPRNLPLARRQLERFGRRAELVEAAVATRDGNVRFLPGESNTGRITDASEPAGITVPAVDLARILKRHRDASMLLKMDIEGAERAVLPHVMDELPARCALFLETHGGEAAWSEARTLLEARAFRVVRTRGRGEFVDGYAERN